MRRLGQHFLKNKAAVGQIVRAVSPKAGEVIVEIGPGHGELTQEIVNRITHNAGRGGARIIAVEKDERLAEKLCLRFAENENIKIMEGDALRVLPGLLSDLRSTFPVPRFKICGNIPYYITGHLLRTIGELEPKPELCVFTLQKEVAERLVAEPRRVNPVRGRGPLRALAASYGMNRLAASVQFWAEPEVLFALPKTDFRPPPKVDSAVVLLKTKKLPAGIRPDDYYKIVRILFQQPRKTIFNNLRAGGWSPETALQNLKRAGLEPGLRPQDLSIRSIVHLSSFLRPLSSL